MKTKMFKISGLALAVAMATFGTYYVANAQTVGQVSLTIDAGTSSCDVGGDVNLGTQTIAADFGALNFQGAFNTTVGLTNTWSCTDSNGTPWGWDLSIQSSDLTNTNGNIIAANNVTISHDAPTVTAGMCTVVGGSAMETAINVAHSIMGKAAGASVCTIQTPNVNLSVHVPANQAPGTYQGTLSITLPTFG